MFLNLHNFVLGLWYKDLGNITDKMFELPQNSRYFQYKEFKFLQCMGVGVCGLGSTGHKILCLVFSQT